MVRIRSRLAACAVALVVLVGCSGGDDDTDEAAPTTTSAPGNTVTTVRPVDTRFTGENSAQFCALAKTYNERFTSVGTNPTPAQLRTVAREGQTAINQAVTSAPAEIKKDVEVLAAAFGTFLTELEKANFDVTKLPPTALGQLSAPEFQASSTRFQAYTRTVCGIN
ncbi:MAG: hypothetical protein ACR2KK_06745 [Acidimicrobiales bacterium]